MARGFVGPAPGVVALGIELKKWDLAQLQAFEASVESRKGRVERVQSFHHAERFPGNNVDYEVLQISDDDNREVVFVKIFPGRSSHGESSTVLNYLASKAPLGGLKLIGRNESVSFVTVESKGDPHAFVEPLIECCSTKLDALPVFSITCVDGGLNNMGFSLHHLEPPTDCPALLAIIGDPHEAILSASGRSLQLSTLLLSN